MSNPIPTRDAVRAILAKQFRPAEELPHKRGITEGFDVFCYPDGVAMVNHYVPPQNAVGIADEVKAAWLRRYEAALSAHYSVTWTEGRASLRVTAKPAELTDDALADELRAAYQSGGARTYESWIAVAQRARELLGSKT